MLRDRVNFVGMFGGLFYIVDMVRAAVYVEVVPRLIDRGMFK